MSATFSMSRGQFARGWDETGQEDHLCTGLNVLLAVANDEDRLRFADALGDGQGGANLVAVDTPRRCLMALQVRQFDCLILDTSLCDLAAHISKLNRRLRNTPVVTIGLGLSSERPMKRLANVFANVGRESARIGPALCLHVREAVISGGGMSMNAIDTTTPAAPLRDLLQSASWKHALGVQHLLAMERRETYGLAVIHLAGNRRSGFSWPLRRRRDRAQGLAASAIRGCLGADAEAAQVGETDYAVLMPNVNAAEMAEIAEAVRLAIEYQCRRCLDEPESLTVYGGFSIGPEGGSQGAWQRAYGALKQAMRSECGLSIYEIPRGRSALLSLVRKPQ